MKIIPVSILVYLLSVCCYGQEESFPCKCCNSDLKKLFETQRMERLYVHACSGPGLHALSSSFLKPGGTPPEIISNGIDPPEDTEYVNWTCKYSMGNIGDRNPATAWVEGVDGEGIGEVLIVPCLELTEVVKIWTGYGKSDALFQANSRPKVIRVAIIKAKMDGASQYGTYYKDLRIVEEKNLTLRDQNGYQNLVLPDFDYEQYWVPENEQFISYNYFLGIEIKDVYPGNKYQDTCISEVIND